MKYDYPLVECQWLDAEGDSGWTDPKKAIEHVPVINIGFLITENEDYIKLAASYINKPNDDQVSSTDIIPKNMVVSMKELSVRYKTNGKQTTKTKNKAAQGALGEPGVSSAKSPE